MTGRTNAFLAGVLLLFAAFGRAQAGVTYDLRLSDNDTSGGLITYPGEVIALNLFARVTGSTAAVEGFQEGYGSVIATTSGGVSGGLSSTLAAPFQADGAQPGRANNLNSDSVMDIGSNLTVASTDFLFARAATMQTSGTAITNGQEFKLATVYFTATSDPALALGSSVNVSFRVTSFTGITSIEALWQQDGVFQTSSFGGNAALPTATVGVTLVNAIPEPSSALLLGVGVLAAGVRRFRRA